MGVSTVKHIFQTNLMNKTLWSEQDNERMFLVLEMVAGFVDGRPAPDAGIPWTPVHTTQQGWSTCSRRFPRAKENQMTVAFDLEENLRHVRPRLNFVGGGNYVQILKPSRSVFPLGYTGMECVSHVWVWPHM